MQFLYEFLMLIPDGKVTSYKVLANIFGLHPRQVANILSNNKQTNIYPCYKVVQNDGKIGGYNLGIEHKINKLEKEGINIEKAKNLIDSKVVNFQNYLWKPKLFNFFVAFPLEGEEEKKFKELISRLDQFNNGSFTLQKSTTPHITLRFFGELNLKLFHRIIYKTKKNINKIKTSLKNQIISFNLIDNFGERVWFYKPQSRYVENEFKKFYVQFHKITGLQIERRPYSPHLTILRVKEEKEFNQIKENILNILEQYDFKIKINKLRFYAAVDNVFQVPLIDIDFNI